MRLPRDTGHVGGREFVLGHFNFAGGVQVPEALWYSPRRVWARKARLDEERRLIVRQLLSSELQALDCISGKARVIKVLVRLIERAPNCNRPSQTAACSIRLARWRARTTLSLRFAFTWANAFVRCVCHGQHGIFRGRGRAQKVRKVVVWGVSCIVGPALGIVEIRWAARVKRFSSAECSPATGLEVAGCRDPVTARSPVGVCARNSEIAASAGAHYVCVMRSPAGLKAVARWA